MAAYYVLEWLTLGARLAGIVWSEVSWRTLLLLNLLTSFYWNTEGKCHQKYRYRGGHLSNDPHHSVAAESGSKLSVSVNKYYYYRNYYDQNSSGLGMLDLEDKLSIYQHHYSRNNKT